MISDAAREIMVVIRLGSVLDLGDIHFHDSRLIRVVEDAETHDLHFEVQYPVDWENNVFEPWTIVFLDVLNYRIDEIPFEGAPTLLDWHEHESERGGYRSVTLNTNAGTRSLLFKTVELRPSRGAG